MQSVRMSGLLLTLATTCFVLLHHAAADTALHKGEVADPLDSKPSRSKRSSPHVIKECVTVTSESGRYFVRAPQNSDGEQVCGIYLTAEPDTNIRVTFDYFDVPCHKGGLVAFVDGWELNGEVFPSASDHEKDFEDRFEEFCGVPRIKKILQASQNAALLQYRFPKSSGDPHGFSFTVRHVPNLRPCNVLAESTNSLYTLRNYGRKVNCSITMLSPGSVQLIALQIGVQAGVRTILEEHETGILHKCGKRGSGDYVEIGGSKGLDTREMVVNHQLCGMDSKPDFTEMLVGCPITTVRLVSTGFTDNTVTFTLRTADADDFSEAGDDTVLCFQ